MLLSVPFRGSNRRFKLPLRDLTPGTLPEKLCFLLSIPTTSEAVFERYSDSAAAFIVLDPKNTSVYKQLYRAAKAKLKLRLKVTVTHKEPTVYPGSVAEIQRGFEELLINGHQRPSTSYVSPFATQPSSSSTCYGPEQALFHHKEVPRMSTCSGSEIPITRANAARDKWFAELANISNRVNERQRLGRDALATGPSVYCNNCQASTSDAHYHCSTCDDGDFDLCQTCVDNGITCGGVEHWLIKRFVKNGQYIYGVRHKCLDCPDWDFCSACHPNASFIHAGHRCEASPSNRHNRTHPLIKFKTPVRNVSVTTLGDHEDGQPRPVMGDRRGCTTSKATETTPASSINAATQVQTVADLKPTEPVKSQDTPGDETKKAPEIAEVKKEAKELPDTAMKEELIAHFVRDVIADGTVLPPNCVFEQTCDEEFLAEQRKAHKK
ncbi:hypothetical protein BUE80_DR012841 [Diplocarpon rosae]|nr:hypothetical protein BUE80_DR012841 [Diplocarpon rosae]